MAALLSVAPVPGSTVATNAGSGGLETVVRQLDSLNRPEWQYDFAKYVNQLTPAQLVPPVIEKAAVWLDMMPYERMLRVCDARIAHIILSWITNPRMLDTLLGPVYAASALQIMDSVDRIPVFIGVVKYNRIILLEEAGRIDFDGLLARNALKHPDNGFFGQLPPNIRRVWNIEQRRQRYLSEGRQEDYAGIERVCEKAFTELIETLVRKEARKRNDFSFLMNPATKV